MSRGDDSSDSWGIDLLDYCSGGLFLAAVGAVFLVLGIRWLMPIRHWRQAAGPLTFGLGGFIFSCWGIFFAWKNARHVVLSRRIGRKPWLFRRDWRQLRVNPTATWLMIRWSLVLFAPPFFIMLDRGGLVGGLVFASFCGGCGLLLLSCIRDSVARLVKGRMQLHLSKLPLLPGSTLVATLHGSKQFRDAKSLEMTLKVVRRMVVNDRDDSEGGVLADIERYSQTTEVEPATLRDADDGCLLVPARFDLPADLPGTSYEPDSALTWRLLFRTKGLFLGTSLEYRLPVFHVRQDTLRE